MAITPTPPRGIGNLISFARANNVWLGDRRMSRVVGVDADAQCVTRAGPELEFGPGRTGRPPPLSNIEYTYACTAFRAHKAHGSRYHGWYTIYTTIYGSDIYAEICASPRRSCDEGAVGASGANIHNLALKPLFTYCAMRSERPAAPTRNPRLAPRLCTRAYVGARHVPYISLPPHHHHHHCRRVASSTRHSGALPISHPRSLKASACPNAAAIGARRAHGASDPPRNLIVPVRVALLAPGRHQGYLMDQHGGGRSQDSKTYKARLVPRHSIAATDVDECLYEGSSLTSPHPHHH